MCKLMCHVSCLMCDDEIKNPTPISIKRVQVRVRRGFTAASGCACVQLRRQLAAGGSEELCRLQLVHGGVAVLFRRVT